jgi:riboflavin kinase/FMN adenylyltransferase
VYLLDFDGTIYGKRITIEFLQKLRDEARFPDLATLTRQMHDDVAHAREYLARAEAGLAPAPCRSSA